MTDSPSVPPEDPSVPSGGSVPAGDRAAEQTSEPSPAVEPDPPSEEELRAALKAFRKRLKLMRLDEESRLGYGPTSTGGRSRIDAIRPPDQFPKAVWKALAREGKLRNIGKGLYQLLDR